LFQVIPHLGQALFQQKVGSALEFKLELSRGYEQIHQARFESIPPTWGHQRHKQAMALKASVHKSSLRVGRAGAMRLINELIGGMDPRVTYRMGLEESSDQVEVNLSALTFADQLAKFQHCIDNLLPYQYDEVKESIVYFNFDSARLTAKAQKALAKVAEYVRLDKNVKRIKIAGYTDSKGFRRYNYRLARQRARAVERFFLEHGINKSRLTLSAEAFGEKQPAASNKSAAGRAQNRRVHVSLFK
jgi:outer membrane protein OmpA-like peptidoglycan-associated protein